MNDDEIVSNFIRARKIDTIQKLVLLLLLYQYPSLAGTSQEIAERLNFSDSGLLEQLMSDLHQAGILVCANDHYRLDKGPDIQSPLKSLIRVLADPTAFQKLFEQIAEYAFRGYNHRYNLKKPLQDSSNARSASELGEYVKPVHH